MEEIEGTMIGKPLVGLLFGLPVMVCAFSMEELPNDCFAVEGPPEYEGDMRTMSLYEPLQQWWDHIIKEPRAAFEEKMEEARRILSPREPQRIRRKRGGRKYRKKTCGIRGSNCGS